MNIKIKIPHLIFTISIIIIVLRVDLLIDLLSLLVNYILLLFSNYSYALNLANPKLFDYFFNALLLIALPILSIVLRKKLNKKIIKLNFTNISITVLCFIFLFAPIITNENPNFHKNISVTKLLPPLSKAEFLRFSKWSNDTENTPENFIERKNKIIKREFDESIIFFTKVKFDSSITVYQNRTEKIFEAAQFENRNGTPLVFSKIYFLGTDQFGRDVFTRLVYGTRISILIGICSVMIALILGFTFGAFAGLIGGFTDRVLSRITDVFLAFPIIFLVIMIIGLFGNSIYTIIIVLGFSGWMSLFKITKTELVSLKNKDYFLSAQMIGLNKTKLIKNEVVPIISAPIIVNIIFQFGNVILAEAALSFLGLGIGSEFPSWGSMIQSGQSYITTAWWMILFPSLFLVLTLLTAKNLGNNLNQILNPKLKYD